MPCTHCAMIWINLIVNNKHLNWAGAKISLSFLGTLIYVNMFLRLSAVMYAFKLPMKWGEDLGASAIFLFFEVEWVVFLGTIFANIVFIALRTCVRHKIQLD